MSIITYYDKSGKRILKRDFIKNQKASLLDGNAVKVSLIKKDKTLITKSDLNEMEKDGLIEMKKYKNKTYLSKEELLYALKVQDRRRKINIPKQDDLFSLN
jgi:hypothetical protein